MTETLAKDVHEVFVVELELDRGFLAFVRDPAHGRVDDDGVSDEPLKDGERVGTYRHGAYGHQFIVGVDAKELVLAAIPINNRVVTQLQGLNKQPPLEIREVSVVKRHVVKGVHEVFEFREVSVLGIHL